MSCKVQIESEGITEVTFQEFETAEEAESFAQYAVDRIEEIRADYPHAQVEYVVLEIENPSNKSVSEQLEDFILAEQLSNHVYDSSKKSSS